MSAQTSMPNEPGRSYQIVLRRQGSSVNGGARDDRTFKHEMGVHKPLTVTKQPDQGTAVGIQGISDDQPDLCL